MLVKAKAVHTLPQPQHSVILEAVNRLHNPCQSVLQRQQDSQERYDEVLKRQNEVIARVL